MLPIKHRVLLGLSRSSTKSGQYFVPTCSNFDAVTLESSTHHLEESTPSSCCGFFSCGCRFPSAANASSFAPSTHRLGCPGAVLHLQAALRPADLLFPPCSVPTPAGTRRQSLPEYSLPFWTSSSPVPGSSFSSLLPRLATFLVTPPPSPSFLSLPLPSFESAASPPRRRRNATWTTSKKRRRPTTRVHVFA